MSFDLLEPPIDFELEPPADFELDDDDPALAELEALAPPPPLARSGFTFRPYQSDAMTETETGWAEAKRQLLVMATGTGKTVVFSELARRGVEHGQRALILAHTDELVEQARDKLATNGLGSGKEKAKSYASRRDWVVVASVQTIGRPDRLAGWAKNHFGLVVVDECHRIAAATYQRVVDHFCPHANLLGVTATATRADKKALGKFFDRIAYDYGLLKACRDAWLVRPLVRTCPLQIDISKVKSTKGDLDSTQLSHAIEPFLIQIATHIREEAPHRRILCFLPSVETAAKMAECLKAVGYKADYVSGACTDRDAKVRAYKQGHLQALCNCAVLTEGFDHDAIDCVVCLRPTRVPGLYAQIIGRGTRPLNAIVRELNAAPDAAARAALIRASAKPHLLLLDFLWLYEKHDLLRPASLFSTDPEVIKRMAADGDLLNIEERAERDVLEALRKAAAKNKHRERALIDPLAFATTLGDVDLADYEPQSLWECGVPTDKQKAHLQKQGIDVSQVKTKGHASKLIFTIITRRRQGLCTFRQARILEQFGVPNASSLTYAEASQQISTLLPKAREKSSP